MSFEPILHIKVGLCFDGATIPVGQLARDGRGEIFCQFL